MFIHAVMNVHGEIRTVIDLARLLERSDAEDRSDAYVLLVRTPDAEVGFRVDGIEKIQLVSLEKLAVPADDAAGTALRYLRGLTPDKIRVLNLDVLFRHPIFARESREPFTAT